MVDVIVNHVSSSSPPFLDWLAKRGPDSAYDGMFLTIGGVFPDGATEEELTRHLPAAAGPAVHPVHAGRRQQAAGLDHVHPQQVDIDVRPGDHPRSTCSRVLDRLARVRGPAGAAGRGRLRGEDPRADVVHDPGDLPVHRRDRPPGVTSAGWRSWSRCTPTTASRSRSPSQVDQVYDFALPPLVLHALTAADADPLLAWMEVRPTNTFTVLDTHDGIGVIDVGRGRHRPVPGRDC